MTQSINDWWFYSVIGAQVINLTDKFSSSCRRNLFLLPKEKFCNSAARISGILSACELPSNRPHYGQQKSFKVDDEAALMKTFPWNNFPRTAIKCSKNKKMLLQQTFVCCQASPTSDWILWRKLFPETNLCSSIVLHANPPNNNHQNVCLWNLFQVHT